MKEKGILPKPRRILFWRISYPGHFQIFEDNVFYPYRFKRNFQHNFCSHIPKDSEHKFIVSNKRNPLDIYVSLFESRDWILNLNKEELSCVMELFPTYPDLNFRQFLSFCQDYLNDRLLPSLLQMEIRTKMGFLSTLFLLTYYKDYKNILNTYSGRVGAMQIREFQYPVIFLEQQNLNRSLYLFLANQGYPSGKIDFILSADRINVSDTRKEDDFLKYFDSDTLAYIVDREYLIFDVFPKYV